MMTKFFIVVVTTSDINPTHDPLLTQQELNHV
jgi:hypothetical protein